MHRRVEGGGRKGRKRRSGTDRSGAVARHRRQRAFAWDARCVRVARAGLRKGRGRPWRERSSRATETWRQLRSGAIRGGVSVRKTGCRLVGRPCLRRAGRGQRKRCPGRGRRVGLVERLERARVGQVETAKVSREPRGPIRPPRRVLCTRLPSIARDPCNVRVAGLRRPCGRKRRVVHPDYRAVPLCPVLGTLARRSSCYDERPCLPRKREAADRTSAGGERRGRCCRGCLLLLDSIERLLSRKRQQGRASRSSGVSVRVLAWTRPFFARPRWHRSKSCYAETDWLQTVQYARDHRRKQW